MKKALFYSLSCALLALGSVKPAAAQQVCTAGYSCGMDGARDGSTEAKSWCGNPSGRARLSEDYWNRALQAQAQGRWDDYAYLSAYSDALSNAGCPYPETPGYYGVRTTKATQDVAIVSKQTVVASK
jgi:hypothetical protein